MSVRLHLTVEDSDGLLSDGMYGAAAVIRVQWSATAGGTYADLSGTGSDPTVPLVAGVRDYYADDPSGTSTRWYRSRYENAGGTILSDWSAVFQAGAETGTWLCTIGQVKARLFPAGPTDTTDDGLIAELIEQISDWIGGYTGRILYPVNAATYVFDTSYGNTLRIPMGLRSATSVGVNNLAHQPDSGGSYTTVAAADYLLRPKPADLPPGWPATELRISRAATGTIHLFGNIENGCTITGDFGFAAVPADIAAVAIDAAVAAYQSRKNGASSVLGADGTALPPWSQFFGRGSPQRGTLDRYRYWAIS